MITDEQMKALVKFARSKLTQSRYELLFDNYNQELLVQICYNMNKDLDKCYDTKKYPKVYKARTKVLELLDKWLKSNNDERTAMKDDLVVAAYAANHASYTAAVSYTNNPTNYAYAAAAYAAAAYAAASSVDYAANAAAYAAADDAAYAAYYAANSTDSAYVAESNTNEIIIKTILDYYGEDFETFEALYL